MKRFLLRRKEHFGEKGHKISLVYETVILSNSNEIYMTFESYIELSIPLFELNWTKIFHKAPHVIKSPDGKINRLLIRKHRVTPGN